MQIRKIAFFGILAAALTLVFCSPGQPGPYPTPAQSPTVFPLPSVPYPSPGNREFLMYGDSGIVLSLQTTATDPPNDPNYVSAVYCMEANSDAMFSYWNKGEPCERIYHSDAYYSGRSASTTWKKFYFQGHPSDFVPIGDNAVLTFQPQHSQVIAYWWPWQTSAAGYVRNYKLYNCATDALVQTIAAPTVTATITGLTDNTQYCFYLDVDLTNVSTTASIIQNAKVLHVTNDNASNGVQNIGAGSMIKITDGTNTDYVRVDSKGTVGADTPLNLLYGIPHGYASGSTVTQEVNYDAVDACDTTTTLMPNTTGIKGTRLSLTNTCNGFSAPNVTPTSSPSKTIYNISPLNAISAWTGAGNPYPDEYQTASGTPTPGNSVTVTATFSVVPTPSPAGETVTININYPDGTTISGTATCPTSGNCSIAKSYNTVASCASSTTPGCWSGSDIQLVDGTATSQWMNETTFQYAVPGKGAVLAGGLFNDYSYQFITDSADDWYQLFGQFNASAPAIQLARYADGGYPAATHNADIDHTPNTYMLSDAQLAEGHTNFMLPQLKTLFQAFPAINGIAPLSMFVDGYYIGRSTAGASGICSTCNAHTFCATCDLSHAGATSAQWVSTDGAFFSTSNMNVEYEELGMIASILYFNGQGVRDSLSVQPTCGTQGAANFTQIDRGIAGYLLTIDTNAPHTNLLEWNCRNSNLPDLVSWMFLGLGPPLHSVTTIAGLLNDIPQATGTGYLTRAYQNGFVAYCYSRVTDATTSTINGSPAATNNCAAFTANPGMPIWEVNKDAAFMVLGSNGGTESVVPGLTLISNGQVPACTTDATHMCQHVMEYLPWW